MYIHGNQCTPYSLLLLWQPYTLPSGGHMVYYWKRRTVCQWHYDRSHGYSVTHSQIACSRRENHIQVCMHGGCGQSACMVGVVSLHAWRARSVCSMVGVVCLYAWQGTGQSACSVGVDYSSILLVQWSLSNLVLCYGFADLFLDNLNSMIEPKCLMLTKQKFQVYLWCGILGCMGADEPQVHSHPHTSDHWPPDHWHWHVHGNNLKRRIISGEMASSPSGWTSSTDTCVISTSCWTWMRGGVSCGACNECCLIWEIESTAYTTCTSQQTSITYTTPASSQTHWWCSLWQRDSHLLRPLVASCCEKSTVSSKS